MTIAEILEKEGPNLSSVIKKELVASSGISDEAARQQISRARSNVHRLSSIVFPKREAFLYLNSQFKSFPFYNKLAMAFDSTGSVHKYIIHGLDNFGGCVSIDKLRVLSGCPKARKNHKSFDRVVKELENVGALYETEGVYYLQETCALYPRIDVDTKTIASLNDIMKEMLAHWLKNNCFISYNSDLNEAEFCSYFWDIKAPSYLLPLSGKSGTKVKPGFVVADVMPMNNIELRDIEYFTQKVEACFLGKNTVPFLPILLGYSFTRDAWDELKHRNILAATVRNFFGEDIEQLLESIVALLQSKNIDNMKDVLKRLSKLEGSDNNFRGHFFELIVYNIATNCHTNTPDLNKKIRETGKPVLAEMDVFAVDSDTVTVYECKGYKPTRKVTKHEIEKWEKKDKVQYLSQI